MVNFTNFSIVIKKKICNLSLHRNKIENVAPMHTYRCFCTRIQVNSTQYLKRDVNPRTTNSRKKISCILIENWDEKPGDGNLDEYIIAGVIIQLFVYKKRLRCLPKIEDRIGYCYLTPTLQYANLDANQKLLNDAYLLSSI